MRIVTFVTLLALSSYAILADAANEPLNPQERNHSIVDRSGKEVSAKKDTLVVRTRSGSSSFNVSTIMGRR